MTDCVMIRRYHMLTPDLKQLSDLLVEQFLDSHTNPPDEHRCFLPLYVFAGRHLLPAQLRPSNIDGAQGARTQVRRIVTAIRKRWPAVETLLRGDFGFVQENQMRWREGNNVDFVFGLARDDFLLKKAERVRGKIAVAMVKSGRTERRYGDFHHMTNSKSWAIPRRAIAKVEHHPGRVQRCRYLVTSLKRQKVAPKESYECQYCPMGDMENRIEECRLDLFADRTSASAYRFNQLRLLLAAFAYVLVDAVRREALNDTALAKATPGTIRVKLFKIGARVITSMRRIKVSLPDVCPYKTLFFKAYQALTQPVPI